MRLRGLCTCESVYLLFGTAASCVVVAGAPVVVVTGTPAVVVMTGAAVVVVMTGAIVVVVGAEKDARS